MTPAVGLPDCERLNENNARNRSKIVSAAPAGCRSHACFAGRAVRVPAANTRGWPPARSTQHIGPASGLGGDLCKGLLPGRARRTRVAQALSEVAVGASL